MPYTWSGDTPTGFGRGGRDQEPPEQDNDEQPSGDGCAAAVILLLASAGYLLSQIVRYVA